MRTAIFCIVFTSAGIAEAAGTLGGCQLLPNDHAFNTPVNALLPHASSSGFIGTLGAGTTIHLDLGSQTDSTQADYYGIPYNLVRGSIISWKVVNYKGDILDPQGNPPDAYPNESDCANPTGHAVIKESCQSGRVMPIADSTRVEGGIVVDSTTADDQDHHILTVDTDTCTLWESWHSYQAGGEWDILSSAYFDLASNALRSDGLTSADAAGFPILPLLLRADEASSGVITHALRFTMPSGDIIGVHVWPATHHAGSGADPTVNPPMGQLFRLKDSFVIPSTYNTQSRAILQALKTYGMYLADGGTAMYITGEPSAGWLSDTFDQVQTVTAGEFEALDVTPITLRTGFHSDSAAVPGAPNTGGGGTAGSGGAGSSSGSSAGSSSGSAGPTAGGTSSGSGASAGTTAGGALTAGSGSSSGSSTAGATGAKPHGCSSASSDLCALLVFSLLLSVRSARRRVARAPKTASTRSPPEAPGPT